MRWILVHMIEETGRHAGHADILREQIDDPPAADTPTAGAGPGSGNEQAEAEFCRVQGEKVTVALGPPARG